MAVNVFLAKDFETTHERQIFLEIKERLDQDDLKGRAPVMLLGNFACGGNEIDAAILKNDAIIVVEFKNYGGEIVFSENGDWLAGSTPIKGGKNGRNPCQQVRAYKYALVNFLGEHEDKILTQKRDVKWGHISGMVVFHNKIHFDRTAIPQRMKPWFNVVDIDSVVQTVNTITSKQLVLSNEELNKIPNLLGLQSGTPATIAEPEHKTEPVEVQVFTPRPNVKSKPRNTPSERTIDYYIRCIEQEDFKRSEISDDPANIQWLPIPSKNLLVERGELIEIAGADELIHFVKKEDRREKPRTLFYGTPVIKKRGNGREKDRVIPVFIASAAYEENNGTLRLFRVEGEEYSLNRNIIHLSGITLPEEVEAINSEIDSIPSYADKIVYLNSKCGLDIRPDSPSVIFYSETSDFTRNLLNELKALQPLSDTKEFLQTPARYLLNGQRASKTVTTNQFGPTLQVFPLNPSQKHAVQQAFTQEISVVTGPPGTGKSQVVLNILANAIVQGKTVLFASKNNLAVDVVNERFTTTVTDGDWIVRIGNKTFMAALKERLEGLMRNIVAGKFQVTEQEVREAESERAKNLQRIKKHMADLEELKALPAEIEQSHSSLEQLIQNNQSKVQQLQSSRDGESAMMVSLKDRIPPPLFTAFSATSNPLQVRTKELEGLNARALALLNRAGIGLWDQILVRVHPKTFTRKMERVLDKYETVLPFSVLDWMDKQSAPGNDFKKMTDRFGLLLRVKSYQEDYGRFKELQQKVETIDKDLTRTIKANAVTESEGRRRIEQLESRLKELRSLEGTINAEMPDLNKNRHILSSKYVNLLWKQKLSNTGAAAAIAGYLSIAGSAPRAGHGGKIVKKLLKFLPLWSVSSLAVRNGLPLLPSMFDLVVIDEASQCDIPSAIPLFYRAKSVMVIGDPLQLRHISGLDESEDTQLAIDAGEPDLAKVYSKISLYDKAERILTASNLKPLFLDEHYRCDPKIIGFSNIYFYLPKTGRELIVRTQVPGSGSADDAIVWHHVSGEVAKYSKSNFAEVKKVFQILNLILSDRRRKDMQIGITTPFRHQADALTTRMSSSNSNVVADTIHKFQGNEKDIMIFSPVVSMNATDGMIQFINVNAPELLNVAVTRARKELHVVGDYSECRKVGGVLGGLAKYIHTFGKIEGITIS